MFSRPTIAAITLFAVAALGFGGHALAQDDAPKDDTKASYSMSATEVVDGMQKFYDEANTFSADFTQKFEDITKPGEPKVSKGVVFFKKGGKMRWDYAKGSANDEKFLISNGKTFWSWEPTYNQYCAMDLSQATLPSALTFLAGEGDIKKDFDVTVVGEDDNRIQIELTPKTPNPNYEVLEFNIRKTNFRVDQVIIVDALGNENNMYFKKAEFNAKMDDGNFAFDPPADANHICGEGKGG